MLPSLKSKLTKLLTEWLVSETCDNCQHIETFRDGDLRHPCNRCDCYDKFKLSNNVRSDIKDKVNELIKIIEP